MSWKIQIIKAKPNPQGKDTAWGHPISKKLLGEWVDLKNIGDQRVALSTLHLANRHFDAQCRPAQNMTLYWQGPSGAYLEPGESVRVHTGRSADRIQMEVADQYGATYHAYAESGQFILNNRCGDNLGVYYKDTNGNWVTEDYTSYDPNPPEGAVLNRVGAKLVVEVQSTTLFRR